MNEKIQQDIAKMEAAIAQLKAGGEELFADQIAEVQSKIDALKAEAAAEVEEVVTEAKEIEQNIVQKYGACAARAVQIILLALILYKLF